MSKTKKRRGRIIAKIVIISATLLIVGVFAINWFMTNRLEKYLRSYLSENISELTNGFYHFTFDSLSVGLFDGELSIRGLEMYPDSTILAQLQEKDSLPDLYFNIKIEAIDLKGINLTWRRDYRNLVFRDFEIKTPTVIVTQNKNSQNNDDELIPEDTSGDLFSIISPFFDQISVKQMNMDEASVSYIIKENKIITSKYALSNVDLHTFNFLLNKNSKTDPRLFYCDNIIFEADQPQTILTDNHCILEAQKLEFNTRDSLIQIKGAKLTAQEDFWAQRTSIPGNYIDASINLVEMTGIHFFKKNGRTEFTANSFRIDNSLITCFSVNNSDDDTNKKALENEGTVTSGTLYDIVAPVLSKVAINNLALETAMVKYNIVKDGQIDNFRVHDFNFHASSFLLDSLSTFRKQFWHCKDYAIDATGIEGRVNSKNYSITLDKMSLNTFEGQVLLDNIKLSKLDSLHNEHRSYVTGNISSVNISGINLDEGVTAENFSIENPKLELYVVEANNEEIKENPKLKDGDIWNLFVPYADYFLVKNIKINNAHILYHNVNKNEKIKLNRFYFYAKDFLVDEATRKQSTVFYTCTDFGFQFTDFDNILLGKKYRLQIQNAELSHIKKELLLQDVKLTPLENTWDVAPDIYFALTSPQIRIEATKSVLDNNLIIDSINLNSITIDSPDIKIVKTRNSTSGKSKDDKKANEFLKQLGIEAIKINNANISFSDKVNNKVIDIKLEKLIVDSIELSSIDGVTIEDLTLSDTKIDIKQNAQHSFANLPAVRLNNFGYYKNKDGIVSLSMKLLDLPSPTINIDIIKHSKEVLEKPRENKAPKDKYQLIKELTKEIPSNLNISKLNISDANVSFVMNGISSKNEVGATSLSLDGLKFETANNTLYLDDIQFSSKNLRIPTSSGFYTILVDNVSADSKQKEIVVENIHLLAKYPKEDFAHKHPKGKDWFDVKVGNVTLTGIDIPTYLAKNEVYATYLGVHDVTLDNFKNQKIEITHNKMPLIYEGLQKAPLKFSIDSLDVTNFTVDYQELPVKGDIAGTILFQGMNGRLKNFTNIATEPDQLMNLHADGIFMNTGKFDAVWKIPVSSDYDRFFVDAHLYKFPLTELNQTLIPLGSAKLNSGYIKDVWITMDATSEGASSTMLLLYNDLDVSLYRDPNMERPYKFVNRLVSLILKKNNPNKENEKPRHAEATIIRDKYHSTFNYFWQIIQPTLIESVGISQKKQQMGKNLGAYMTRLKKFFRPGGKDKKKKEEEQNKGESSK